MNKYEEKIVELRQKNFRSTGIYPFGALPWEYYAGHMDHAIVEKFVKEDLPRLEAEREFHNAQRGRVNAKLVAAGHGIGIPLAELSPCEIKVFAKMRVARQAGLTIGGYAVACCDCRWCCSEGMTCVQYKWNRLMDRW